MLSAFHAKSVGPGVEKLWETCGKWQMPPRLVASFPR